MVKNKYEKTFEEWLDLTEFGLVKHDNDYDPISGEYGYWSLVDFQGANLGGIESDRFDNAEGIIERMSGVYLDDYILFDLDELFPDADFEYSSEQKLTLCEWWLEYAKRNPDSYSEASLEFDILDLFVNHYEDINLENCHHTLQYDEDYE